MSGFVQRWRDGRSSYRPAGEVIDPREYEVARIEKTIETRAFGRVISRVVPDEQTAKKFVVCQHYSGSYPAARFRIGLYRRSELVGVAIFSHPSNDLALRPLSTDRESVELGRFVLLDDVPSNGETWTRCRRLRDG
jgi:hypothetical protein